MQLRFEVDCQNCKHGRNLGANDYGCRNKDHYNDIEKRVNKGDFVCGYGEEKED